MKISRWAAKNGYRESLIIGLPLVISMLSSMVMTFTDRIFLGNYSLDALAASLPASLAAFLFLSFFFGVAEYIGVFVSQYAGARQDDRIGSVVWQGICFAVPAGVATVIGYTIPAVCLGTMALSPANQSHYNVYSAFWFNPVLFKRFMQLGVPGGVQFFIDMFAIPVGFLRQQVVIYDFLHMIRQNHHPAFGHCQLL